VRALQSHGSEPIRAHDRSSLRAIASTGSPWDPDAWRWLFEHALDSRKPILNYSGGTEISGGIVCGNFLTPIKPCGFSGPVPGMAADVVNEAGESVRGEVGELVIRGPWIGMTRGFWRDPDRYLETYWSRFENTWVHGDFAAIDADGIWYILGRSDDTIKIAGKRLGPSEVESVLNAHPNILDSAAIGVPDETKGEALAVYCVLRPGIEPSDPLRATLKALVTAQLGKPMAPRDLLFVTALPKTRNAKVMRRVIRSVCLGLPPGDLSSLEDHSTLEAIRQAR
jgi:acetyl-CoA synthetase